MISLSKLAARNLLTTKSLLFQSLGPKYSQLIKNNAYLFASNWCPNAGKTINLPFLADSINEGTITEFVKSNQFLIFQNKENGLSRTKLSRTSKPIRLLFRSRVPKQANFSSSTSTLGTVWMWESPCLILIQKEQNQPKLQNNRLRNRNPNSKPKDNNPKSKNPKLKRNNKPNPKNPPNPNHLKKLPLNPSKPQRLTLVPVSKERKFENPCRGWDKESHKDSNNPKIITPFSPLSNRLTCSLPPNAEKYPTFYLGTRRGLR